MAQLVKWPSCKQEHLHLTCNTQVQKIGVVVYSCNPSAREVGTDGLWCLLASWPMLMGESQGLVRDQDSRSKGHLRSNAQSCPLTSMYTHMCTHTQ